MEKDLRQNLSHILRVVLYGPESTGKTTLAKALAKHYQTQWVQEFARDYLQNKWEEQQAVCTLDDLPIIVAGQLELENQKLAKANKVVFCDTNLVVTRVWSETHFDGYCHPEILAYSEKWSYDLYLLTGIDVPWIKDDLRDRFGSLSEAFKFGAPPHGGSAPGIDRILMLITEEENLREVVAFPMNQQAEDLMMRSPNFVSRNSLDELGIDLKPEKKKKLT